MKARLKSWLIIIVSAAAGLYLLYTGGVDLYNSAQLSSKGIAVKGEVKRIERHRSGGSSARFYVTVEFKDQSGNSHTFKNTRPYGYLFAPEKGEPIEIIYLNADPNIAVINSLWQKYLGPLLSLTVGFLFAWLAKSEIFDKKTD